MALATVPTLAGYLTWIRTVMQVPEAVLPDDSSWIEDTYEAACAIVNRQLHAAAPTIYVLARYNLGGDMLVNWVPDTPPSTYWAELRASLLVGSWVAGVINSSSDQGTSQSMTVPEQLESLTIANLQNLKTPWGRQYLGWAQSVGTMWGVS